MLENALTSWATVFRVYCSTELEFDLGNTLRHFWTGSTVVLQCWYRAHN